MARITYPMNPPSTDYSFIALTFAALVVASAIIAFAMHSMLPFGRGSRCPRKRTLVLADGREVILLAPDANMTVGMTYAEAKHHGYAEVDKSLLAGAVAKALSESPWWQPKGWRSYSRVIGRDPDGTVWALDTHDGKLCELSHMAECDGCLVAIVDLATANERKPEPAAA